MDRKLLILAGSGETNPMLPGSEKHSASEHPTWCCGSVPRSGIRPVARGGGLAGKLVVASSCVSGWTVCQNREWHSGSAGRSGECYRREPL
eukprot:1756371-Rhodomonas_salina.4